MGYLDIINQAKKTWNAPDMMDTANKSASDKIRFSSPLMTYCTYGGIPRNRITEFYGEPGSGKSSSAVDICKNAYQIFQVEYVERCNELKKKINSGSKEAKADYLILQESGPKKILYIDLEHSFDRAWSDTLGIKEQLIFSEIDYDNIAKVRGMDIVFVTTAKTNEEAYDLLDKLGIPFRK